MQTPDDTGARLSRRHRLAGALVGAVWLALLVNALRFVAVYGSELPIEDDLEVPDILRNGGLSWSFLWSQHNEHRNPISRLIQFGLYRLTGDIRSGMYFEVLLLALLALAMIVAARRLRGHASWTDLVFALLWMHTGNSENLLMGHQISLMLPITLVGLVIVAFALHPRGLQASK